MREIRAHARNATAGVVIVTSSEDRDLAIEKMRDGADDYIWKPIQEQNRKLSDCIANALKARERRCEMAMQANSGMKSFSGATLSFGQDRIFLNDYVLCSSVTTKQAKVLQYLAENASERPTADIIAYNLGYNKPNQGGAPSVHKALSELRKRAVKHFASLGVELGKSDFIANRRFATGYEFGEKISIEDFSDPAPTKKKPKHSIRRAQAVSK